MTARFNLALLLVFLSACGSPARPASTADHTPAANHVEAGREAVRVDVHGPVLALAARPEGGFRVGVGADVLRLSPDGEITGRQTLPGQIGALSCEQRHEMVLAADALDPGFGEPVSVADPLIAIAASFDRAFGLSASAIVDLRSGESLAEAPANSTSLVANGGTLLIGHAAGVSALSLASQEISDLATTSGPVVGLTLDHEGHYVAAVEGAGWIRIAPTGETSVLLSNAPTGPIAFDAVHRRLAVSMQEELVIYDYLPLVGQDAATWASRDERPMRPFVAGRYALSGGEYWPFRGDREPDYPADVLWGFYPEAGVVFEGEAPAVSATTAAVACAEQSFAALQAFLTNPPAELEAALGETTSPRFYLWINDYSEAVDPFPEPRRPARLWYWRRDPAVAGRVPGYWKWETTLTQDGTCEIPDPSQTNWSEM